jgi:P_ylase: glycogen/starch/alpha-glucan phosphorylases
MMKRY